MKFMIFLLLFLLIGCGSGENYLSGNPTELKKEYTNNLVNVGPAGLSTLHCLLPEARSQCKKLVNIVLNSEIDKPVLNYLVNGTFSINSNYINDDIETLNVGGRKLKVVLYVSNGPGQRRCKTTKDDSFDVKMCPETFNKSILSDSSLQEKYKNLVRNIKPTYDLYKSEVDFYVVPQLEDNYNISVFNKTISLIKEVLGNDINLVRNPCNCYSRTKTDKTIPSNIIEEHHVVWPSISYSFSNQIISNDGATYRFEGEKTNYPRSISWDRIRYLRRVSDSNILILWKSSFQGLNTDNLPEPKYRNYVDPTPFNSELIGLLRNE